MMSRRFGRILGAATIAMLAAVGLVALAAAAIPSGDDTIHGCYGKWTGLLRLVDEEEGQTCTRFENPIAWNQQGAPGEDGTDGMDGTDGVSGWVTEETLEVIPTVQSAELVQRSATCFDGKKVLGGGGTASDPRLVLNGSFPSTGGSGWNVSFYNTGPELSSVTITVYAVCASVN